MKLNYLEISQPFSTPFHPITYLRRYQSVTYFLQSKCVITSMAVNSWKQWEKALASGQSLDQLLQLESSEDNEANSALSSQATQGECG